MAPEPDAPRPTRLRVGSIEATMPSAGEARALAGVVAATTEVYLSAPPRRALADQIASARAVAAAGLTPVTHIPARAFPSAAAAEHHIARAVAAGVRALLVIGGDIAQTRGPFADSAALIDGVDLARFGIERVDVAGYPDGHPALGAPTVARDLEAKLARISAKRLETGIVTQFCFDAQRIVHWVRDLRARAIDVPLRLGIAGPASARALLAYALRCGVRTPFALSGSALAGAGALLGSADPTDLVRALDRANVVDGGWNDVALHVFSFGGVERSARWAAALAPGAVNASPSDRDRV